jgi:hypothetical protein
LELGNWEILIANCPLRIEKGTPRNLFSKNRKGYFRKPVTFSSGCSSHPKFQACQGADANTIKHEKYFTPAGFRCLHHHLQCPGQSDQ